MHFGSTSGMEQSLSHWGLKYLRSCYGTFWNFMKFYVWNLNALYTPHIFRNWQNVQVALSYMVSYVFFLFPTTKYFVAHEFKEYILYFGKNLNMFFKSSVKSRNWILASASCAQEAITTWRWCFSKLLQPWCRNFPEYCWDLKHCRDVKMGESSIS